MLLNYVIVNFEEKVFLTPSPEDLKMTAHKAGVY